MDAPNLISHINSHFRTSRNPDPNPEQESKADQLPLPLEDFFYISIQYLSHPPQDAMCQICPQFSPTDIRQCFINSLPTLRAPGCHHFFHEFCILYHLTKDKSPFKSCENCQAIHYAARWSGPLLVSLRNRFPGAQLPDIRRRITIENLVKRLERIKDMTCRPWFGDLMEFCEEPERIVEINDKRDRREYREKCKRIQEDRDRQENRRAEVVEFRKAEERKKIREKLERLSDRGGATEWQGVREY